MDVSGSRTMSPSATRRRETIADSAHAEARRWLEASGFGLAMAERPHRLCERDPQGDSAQGEACGSPAGRERARRFIARGRAAPCGPRAIVACAAAMALSCSAAALAQWTQWGGPHRDFTTEAAGLAETWEDARPKQVWKRALGDGYSTVLADGDALYTMYRAGDDEFTVCLDAATGKTHWEYRQASPFTELMTQFGPGPSATPLIVGDRLYSIGTNAVLHCFDKKTGKVRWTHDIPREFGAEVPGRGYSTSPIAYERTVVVYAGGGKEQAVMAFQQEDGKVAWKSLDFEPTHSSPILIRFNNQDQLVCFMAAELAAVNPADGTLLWRHEHPTQYGANLSTPVWNSKDLLFCSAAYDSGSRVIRLKAEGEKTTTEEVWFHRKMRLHHANPVIVGDVVYGSSGDFGPAFFQAVRMSDGEVLWRERGFTKATCLSTGDRLIILDEDGNLALAQASPEGLKIVSQAKVATEKWSWAAPTLVGRRLYIRDRKDIMAFDLG